VTSVLPEMSKISLQTLLLLMEAAKADQDQMASWTNIRCEDRNGVCAGLWHGPEGYVITIPGTSNLLDWKLNLSILPAVSGETGLTYHKGFWEAYQLAKPLLDDYPTGKPLWIIGHSLGAATAAIMACELAYQGTKISCVGLGCPAFFGFSQAPLRYLNLYVIQTSGRGLLSTIKDPVPEISPYDFPNNTWIRPGVAHKYRDIIKRRSVTAKPLAMLALHDLQCYIDTLMSSTSIDLKWQET